MKQKIKFKALTYHGKVIFFTKEFDCPDFEVIPSINFKGIDLPKTTVESQIIDWLDEQDKSSLMIEKDLGVIIDYWIPKKKENQFTILDYLKHAKLSEQMTLDLMAVYTEIKPLLKGKSIKTQIHIMFSHLKVGYKSASNAYGRMLEILQSDNVENAQKLLK